MFRKYMSHFITKFLRLNSLNCYVFNEIFNFEIEAVFIIV